MRKKPEFKQAPHACLAYGGKFGQWQLPQPFLLINSVGQLPKSLFYTDDSFRYPDNGLSRCLARLLMAALLACCSGACWGGVDDTWGASPATQDTAWVQQYAAPVNPSNSSGGLQWGAEEVHNGVNYFVDINNGGIGRCPDGYVLVGLMDTGDFKFGRGKRDHHELLCRKITVR